MRVLSIHRIFKTYGAKVVLADVQADLKHGERIALVGENGAGKTTLARLILGQEAPDSGQINIPAGIQCGYLPQEVTALPETTVREYMEAAQGDLLRLRQTLETLEDQMAQNPPNLDDLLEQYGDLQESFMQRGGYDLDYRLDQVMTHLGIAYLEPARAVTSLSGGEKTRLVLAGLLLAAPDLLILDEPTNHLDHATVEWLENYVADYAGAVLLISHDRHFINAVATHIWELSPLSHQIKLYHGNYDDYRAAQEREYAEQTAAFWQQREEIKQIKSFIRQKTHNPKKAPPPADGDKFIRNTKIATSERTASKLIRDAKNKLSDLEDHRLQHPDRVWRIEFPFNPLPLTSQEAVRLEHLTFAYADHLILEDLTAVVRKGERIILAAPNGTGKTTLLKLIMGLLMPQGGSVNIAPSAKLGYLDQAGELLELSADVLTTYRQEAVGTEQEHLAELHRSGLFSTDLLGGKLVGDLSVGSQRKLDLARLIASRANVLILDEPTNHLDLRSLEALEATMLDFEGAILAVSHDRYFTERIATQIWHLKDGHLQIEPRV